jgi:hypothetical protein
LFLLYMYLSVYNGRAQNMRPGRGKDAYNGSECTYKTWRGIPPWSRNAESFKDQAHLDAIVSEAQEIVNNALAGSSSALGH